MKITQNAIDFILNLMKSNELDPSKINFEIRKMFGKVGIGFNKDKMGKRHQFGELSVVVDYDVDLEGVCIEFG